MSEIHKDVVGVVPKHIKNVLNVAEQDVFDFAKKKVLLGEKIRSDQENLTDVSFLCPMTNRNPKLHDCFKQKLKFLLLSYSYSVFREASS